MPRRRSARRRAAPRRGSSRSPCSGRGCRPAPRGSRRRSGAGCAASRSCDGDDQPGRAEAALHGAGLDERLLDRVQLAARGARPSTVTTSRPSAWRGEHQARAHELAVEVDRARAALALLAGVLRARQAEPLAQHVQQALALPDAVGLARLAVDRAASSLMRSSSVQAQAAACGGQHAQRVAAVGGGAADVVDRARRRARRARRSASTPASGSAPRGSQAVLSRARRRRTPRPRARGAASAPAEPMHVPTRRARRSSASAKRADRDHHRVARADLRELLRPVGRRACGTRAISSSRLERVALRAGDEVRRRRRGACRATDASSTSRVGTRAAAAARRRPARRCRGCRRPCRGCGSAASRPCATRSPGRAGGRRARRSARV